MSNTDVTRVNPADLEAAGARTTQLAEACVDILNRAHAAFARAEGTWSGQAQQRFMAEWQAAHKSLMTQMQMLGQVGPGLRASAAEFAEADAVEVQVGALVAK